MKKVLMACMSFGLALVVSADPIAVLNGTFEAGPAGGATADGWTDAGNNTYYEPSPALVYSSGRAMSMYGDGSAEQNVGVTADAYAGAWMISFDAGFRDDVFTGNATVEVSLVDSVTLAVLDSDSFVVTGTGSPNPASVPLSAQSVVLDLSAGGANNVVLKFQNITGAVSNPWERTALVDNVSIDAVPEPMTLGLLVSFGGSILFIRRRIIM